LDDPYYLARHTACWRVQADAPTHPPRIAVVTRQGGRRHTRRSFLLDCARLPFEDGLRYGFVAAIASDDAGTRIVRWKTSRLRRFRSSELLKSFEFATAQRIIFG